MFELNDITREILGRPNFTCAKIAHRLNEIGYEHKADTKTEDEQAVSIYWLLCLYEKHKDRYLEKAREILTSGKL